MKRTFNINAHILSIETDTDPSVGNGPGARILRIRYVVEGKTLSRSVGWTQDASPEAVLFALLSQVEQDASKVGGAA